MATLQARQRGATASLHQRDRSGSGKRVCGGIGEDQCIEHGVGVQGHDPAAPGAEGRRIVGAEATVQARCASGLLPVAEGCPRSVIRTPNTLTRVAESRHRHGHSVEGCRAQAAVIDCFGIEVHDNGARIDSCRSRRTESDAQACIGHPGSQPGKGSRARCTTGGSKGGPKGLRVGRIDRGTVVDCERGGSKGGSHVIVAKVDVRDGE